MAETWIREDKYRRGCAGGILSLPLAELGQRFGVRLHRVNE